MGLFGRNKPPKTYANTLLSLVNAYPVLRDRLSLTFEEKGGLAYRPSKAPFFEGLDREVDRLLRQETGTAWMRFRLEKDDYGFGWIIFVERDMERVATGVHAVSKGFTSANHEKQLLVAVFPFRSLDQRVYWIYSYKRGAFYPFVPLPEEKRNSTEELRLASAVEKVLPVERALQRWHPLWGIPV